MANTRREANRGQVAAGVGIAIGARAGHVHADHLQRRQRTAAESSRYHDARAERYASNLEDASEPGGHRSSPLLNRWRDERDKHFKLRNSFGEDARRLGRRAVITRGSTRLARYGGVALAARGLYGHEVNKADRSWKNNAVQGAGAATTLAAIPPARLARRNFKHAKHFDDLVDYHQNVGSDSAWGPGHENEKLRAERMLRHRSNARTVRLRGAKRLGQAAVPLTLGTAAIAAGRPKSVEKAFGLPEAGAAFRRAGAKFGATARFRTNMRGVTSKVPPPRMPKFAAPVSGPAERVRAKPRRPILHPTLGHLGQNADADLLNRLSGSDAGETTARFARATRRQTNEFAATIHPLSGRMTSMARGHEVGAAPAMTVGGDRSITALRARRQRAAELAERFSDRGDNALAQRAERVATGTTVGPRQILIHNHPISDRLHREMPSSVDFQGAQQASTAQMRVVTHRQDAARGEPASHVAQFGFHPGGNPAQKSPNGVSLPDLERLDRATQGRKMRRWIRSGGVQMTPVERKMYGLSRSDAAEALGPAHRGAADQAQALNTQMRASGQMPRSYDAGIREQTGGTQARRGGFYTREWMQKRLVDEQQYISLPREAGVVAGSAAIAYGGPRIRGVGIGLRAGARESRDPKTRAQWQKLEDLRATAEARTAPIGRLGHTGAGRALGRKIPAKWRPAAAVIGGTGLVAASLPVKRRSYKPVVVV